MNLIGFTSGGARYLLVQGAADFVLDTMGLTSCEHDEF